MKKYLFIAQLSLAVLLLLICSCQNITYTNSQSNDAISDSILIDNKSYYDKNDSKGFPLTLNSITDMINNFDVGYALSFINSTGTVEHLNTSILKGYPLKVPASTLIPHLQLDSPFTENDGVAVYYILDTDTNGNYYLTYAITPAKYDTTSTPKKVTPILDSTGVYSYLVPTFDGGHKKILQDSFDIMRSLYDSLMTVRELSQNIVYPVNSFQMNFTKKHPDNTFYSEKEIDYFYEDNRGVATIPDNLFLTIEHAAIFTKEYEIANKIYVFNIHTPILIFEYNGNLVFNTGPIVRNNPYKNKAMDVGRLCPPQCD